MIRIRRKKLYLMTMNNDPLHKNVPIDDLPRASSINPPDHRKEAPSFDDVLSVVNSFFKNNSYECGKFYNDGYSIELLKDDLDITALLISLVRIVFDHIRQDRNLDDISKINMSHLYQSIDSQLKIVKNSDKDVAHNFILCKIIGYCMKNYQRYNHKDTTHD